MATSSTKWPTVSGKPPRHHYGIFPWTVLDTTTRRWKNRRAALTAVSGDGLSGRDEGLLYSGKKTAAISGGTSRFDPVLADIMYQWYAPTGGHIYDPFAGGITRGALAHHHHMAYHGVDISDRQVDSNRRQATEMGLSGVTYTHGDGTQPHQRPGSVDMVLTCPPYHDLEVYTSAPRDLSKMGWEEHLVGIRRAAEECYTALRNNRFLVWVTGDLRAPTGELRLLPERTALILQEAGFTPVNTHILVNAVGSRYLMARRWWTGTRSAGRLDQRIIVMAKGDRREATDVVNQAFIETQQGHPHPGTHPPATYDNEYSSP